MKEQAFLACPMLLWYFHGGLRSGIYVACVGGLITGGGGGAVGSVILSSTCWAIGMAIGAMVVLSPPTGPRMGAIVYFWLHWPVQNGQIRAFLLI